jgi:adenylyl-sulfate kinase
MVNGFAVWFTGLPCSGKTTLATALRKELGRRGLQAHLLDGDVLRQSLSADLGFSKDDREAHVRRVVSLASSLMGHDAPVIAALISPYRSMREYTRNHIGSFIEVYLRCPLEVCESRDTKGLYRLARQEKLKDFTGISGEYEPPFFPEIVLDTDRMDEKTCVGIILKYLDLDGKNS